MKKQNLILAAAIVLLLFSGLICFTEKPWKAIPFLMFGAVNLKTYFQMRHSTPAEKQQANPLILENFEFDDITHEIDDDWGYVYSVSRSFKPAKSHAAEVNMLSTYSPHDEYGSEEDMPCIAVIVADEVYEAVEAYQKRHTFNGARILKPQNGFFLFCAKMLYGEDLMYFYGFDDGEEGGFGKAGLCMMYSAQWEGTDTEQKLMCILDEAANSFRKTETHDAV